MAAITLDLMKPNGQRPADHMVPLIITNCENINEPWAAWIKYSQIKLKCLFYAKRLIGTIEQ